MQNIHPSLGGGGRLFCCGDRGLRPHNNHHNYQVLKCPRCDSLNTKFCYYNNYNLSQPRHFCKNCRRYWTKGGVLRNVPIGGGCRKTKRSKPKTVTPPIPQCSSHSSSESTSTTTKAAVNIEAVNDESKRLLGQQVTYGFLTDINRSFEEGELITLGFNGTDQQLMGVGDQELHEKVELISGVESSNGKTGNNVGFGPLDWEGTQDDHHMLFDFTSAVDHDYWSQSQWGTGQDHPGL